MALFCLALKLLCILSPFVAAAGSVTPSNDTLPAQAVDLKIFYGLRSTTPSSNSSGSAVLAPLTESIGLSQSQTTLASIRFVGELRIIDSFTNLTEAITNDTIAYISCDPNANVSNTDPSSTVNSVAARVPKAIILWSATQPHCSISGDFGFPSILSVTSVTDTNALRDFISTNLAQSPTGVIMSASPTSSGVPSATPTPSTGPTTAVAMSILYSITGIITVLFIVIIATGAIRAHRHPERYGPRGGGFPGRPRQSRAKGLARAMLETLPIVKFGDDEPRKTESNAEIELADGTQHAAAKPIDRSVANDKKSSEESEEVVKSPAAAPIDIASGMGPDIQAGATTASSSTKDKEDSTDTDNALGCSICTEDFTKGEDVRVLPCNHKYHPACVDPWLLNVSGTCPLCRVDLRPTKSRESGTGDVADQTTPPIEDINGPEEAIDYIRRRGSNITFGGGRFDVGPLGGGRVDIARLQAAGPQDRLLALRAHRRQQQRDVLAQRGIADPDAEDDEEVSGSRRRRLSMRMRETFGVHTRRQSQIVPASALPVTVAENGESPASAAAAASTVAASPEALPTSSATADAGMESSVPETAASTAHTTSTSDAVATSSPAPPAATANREL